MCTANGLGYKYNALSDSFDELFAVFNSNPNLGIASKIKRISFDLLKYKEKLTKIISMEIDQWSRIWVSTSMGILCFDTVKKEWIDFDHQELNVNCLLRIKDRLYLFGRDNILL